MFSRWPIRKKLSVGVVLLLVATAILAVSGFRNVYSFRGLVRIISRRATELPFAIALAQQVSALHATAPKRRMEHDDPTIDAPLQNLEFERHLVDISQTLERYRERLEENAVEQNNPIGNIQQEMSTIREMEQTLSQIDTLRSSYDEGWSSDEASHDLLVESVNQLNIQAESLPRYLQQRMHALQGDVRGYYRTWIVVTWVTSLVAGTLLLLLIHLFYRWVFRPLRQLIKGSRRVAGGDFNHRIHLDSGDEMDELASAMNEMTERFQQIRDDLDQQVKQRTREVIRGEQLASVGFLAAGVAHEINNPLASIALCAESLEERVAELLPSDDDDNRPATLDEDAEVVNDYLQMIQREAFRCKGITEKLLDFSRLGDVERHSIDLTELVRSVVEMVQHVGKYKRKEIVFSPLESVDAHVNAQEIKQVVLNLITNGLESLAPDGTVTIRIRSTRGQAVLEVSDNGCGMTDEVRAHLFEPFFTRRRGGQAQGTGLGMSISYRIISEHGGHIRAESDGPNRGSRITVTLPRTPNEAKPSTDATRTNRSPALPPPANKETKHRHQAA